MTSAFDFAQGLIFSEPTSLTRSPARWPGVPLHLHGSNLVVEEQFENELGWDIGTLDGQPLIAEDYVFGMSAFLLGGSQAFSWPGCVATTEFKQLPSRVRARLVWGTRFRIATFALGVVVGVPSVLFLPLLLFRSVQILQINNEPPLPDLVMVGLAAIGAMWLGSILIGAWYSMVDAGLSWPRRWAEICAAVAVAPVLASSRAPPASVRPSNGCSAVAR
jgi:hypothetical protein